jgi:hypothetical protein
VLVLFPGLDLWLPGVAGLMGRHVKKGRPVIPDRSELEAEIRRCVREPLVLMGRLLVSRPHLVRNASQFS